MDAMSRFACFRLYTWPVCAEKMQKVHRCHLTKRPPGGLGEWGVCISASPCLLLSGTYSLLSTTQASLWPGAHDKSFSWLLVAAHRSCWVQDSCHSHIWLLTACALLPLPPLTLSRQPPPDEPTPLTVYLQYLHFDSSSAPTWLGAEVPEDDLRPCAWLLSWFLGLWVDKLKGDTWQQTTRIHAHARIRAESRNHDHLKNSVINCADGADTT
jgi:hypothetical protein